MSGFQSVASAAPPNEQQRAKIEEQIQIGLAKLKMIEEALGGLASRYQEIKETEQRLLSLDKEIGKKELELKQMEQKLLLRESKLIEINEDIIEYEKLQTNAKDLSTKLGVTVTEKQHKLDDVLTSMVKAEHKVKLAIEEEHKTKEVISTMLQEADQKLQQVLIQIASANESKLKIEKELQTVEGKMATFKSTQQEFENKIRMLKSAIDDLKNEQNKVLQDTTRIIENNQKLQEKSNVEIETRINVLIAKEMTILERERAVNLRGTSLDQKEQKLRDYKEYLEKQYGKPLKQITFS